MGVFSSMFGFDESKKIIIKNEINIMDAINAHIQWKISLEKHLTGDSADKLDLNIIRRDDQCKLGKWIHGPARKHFNGDDGFITLRDDHAQFHMVAGEIVANMQRNDKAAAALLMQGAYARASRKVVHALTDLSKQVFA